MSSQQKVLDIPKAFSAFLADSLCQCSSSAHLHNLAGKILLFRTAPSTAVHRCLQHLQHWDNQEHPYFSQLRETARLPLGSPSQHIMAWVLTQWSKLGSSHLFLFLRDHSPVLSTVLKTIVSLLPVFYVFQAKQQSVIFLSSMWMWIWFWFFFFGQVTSFDVFSRDSLGKRAQETLDSRTLSMFIFMTQHLQQWK